MVSRGKLPSDLLDDVKLYLGITWNDEPTDRKISGFIASGMSYLNGKLGESADYTKDGMPRTLLMEYVRYLRDSALDVFENNYQALILTMQNERAVNAYVAKTVQTEQ